MEDAFRRFPFVSGEPNDGRCPWILWHVREFLTDRPQVRRMFNEGR